MGTKVLQKTEIPATSPSEKKEILPILYLFKQKQTQAIHLEYERRVVALTDAAHATAFNSGMAAISNAKKHPPASLETTGRCGRSATVEIVG
mgnify:CR=1 FL=1